MTISAQLDVSNNSNINSLIIKDLKCVRFEGTRIQHVTLLHVLASNTATIASRLPIWSLVPFHWNNQLINYPGHPITETENGLLKPKYHAFWR